MDQESTNEYERNTSVEVTDISTHFLTLQLLLFPDDWSSQMLVLFTPISAGRTGPADLATAGPMFSSYLIIIIHFY